MSSQSSGNPSSSTATSYPQRRGSITEYFRPPQSSTYPGPITSAAAQANHRRRMSYSGGTGLTGTSPPTPWFGGYTPGSGGGRRASISSVSSNASSPIDVDADEKRDVDMTSSPPGSSSGSFARRLSFGARALRDVKRSMSFGTVGEGEPENEHRATQESMAPPPPPSHHAAPKHDEVQERMLKGDFYF
ncbi:hypothetical protein TWF788_004051 [Orbilia oligospora]|uniref:Uncharacterized protein n=1 Tax=Orbilia oligospora TaxID=2813651 RepID=A0A7C8K1G8_ORBOL|nr:hypothetical protein TWF788_004051 [Orbilia oligospora]